ncbi:MAG: hypothetical protein KGV44_00675 [Flavobacteriaceae bacterium]|nr:hypothetical protein [Flavobacteriaceae bacterium]
MKKSISVMLLLFSFVFYAQNNDNQKSTTNSKEEKYVKKGYSIGGVPAIAYDSDLGFRYGAILNLYDFGDGSNYPNYDQSLYLEWSKTTKGSVTSQIIYDTRTLIPNIRMISKIGYFTEQALDFYGFNGFYNADLENQKSNSYLSRMFYRQDRKSFTVKADFLGKTKNKNIMWIAGFENYNIKIGNVNIQKLNEGKDEEDKLPEDVPTLYESYKGWGIIKENEQKGGNSFFLKVGAMYDTRDNEANPNKGLWSEAILVYAPNFLGNNNGGYTRLALTHRQYFTLASRLTFAYRLNWQTKVTGTIPFYMLPYMFNSKDTNEGLGGAKTLRGILRNRLVGNGIALGNFEFRYKVLKTKLFKQDFYIALSTFVDAGMVTSTYKVDTKGVKNAYGYSAEKIRKNWFNTSGDKLHTSYGLGVHFALNNNFIIAVDYGRAVSKEDGDSGLYIGLDFLF